MEQGRDSSKEQAVQHIFMCSKLYVASFEGRTELPTQGKFRSLRHALEWDGHGRERHCLQSSDFWEKERRERRREIREAKKFYWFILMSWE